MKDKPMIPYDRKQYEVALSLLPKSDKKLKLLEVGASDKILKDILPKNIEYFSSDHEGENDFVVDLNKGKIPIKDNEFDILVCLETLEHIFYPEKIIKEFKRIVKDDGILIISMPNEYNIWLRLNYLFARDVWNENAFNTIMVHRHIHHPRVKDIVGICTKYFKILKVKHVWFTQKGGKNFVVKSFDRILNSLAKVYPSLFSRVVVVLCGNDK
ncbi:class I SAM-dependent methyltransferase [Nanoarchaeota archaeon]